VRSAAGGFVLCDQLGCEDRAAHDFCVRAGCSAHGPGRMELTAVLEAAFMRCRG
jgi:hypothetical protein